MAHYLTLLKNGQVLHKVELDESTLHIGRGADCEFRIFDERCVVSRRHAVVAFFGGRYWVKNDRARSGTLVNGESADRWTPLEQADAIIIGSYVITYSFGYKWYLDGPTLYTGPETESERTKMAEDPTVMISEQERPEFVRIEFSDGRVQLIHLEQFTLGRRCGNPVWIQDHSVSDTHAEIFAEDGCWYVRDLDSEGGVRVANQPVHDLAPVRSGQTVQLGDARLRFKVQRA